MQGGRGRGNPFSGFGDPFGGFGDPFGGFGDPFGGFGGMPSLFGGRDPFDDPFFTQPFGGIFSSGPIGSPFMDMNPFGSSLFGPRRNPFMNQQPPPPRVYENRHSLHNNSRGPIIEELNSDDEQEQPDAENGNNENSGNHGRSVIQPYVEHPDDEVEGREATRAMQFGNELSVMNNMRLQSQSHLRPEAHSFTFQSSTVTYGGSNGAFHTSSTTRRSGSDGLRFEEYKEADSTTGQAAHRVSRGIHDKGHTVTRNLKSDGQVDTMQVLHNINEDEIDGFEESWKGKARKHLPGWSGGPAITHQGLGESSRNGWALPSTEDSGREIGNNGSGSRLGVRRRAESIEDVQSSKAIRR